jgi:hypothetical protein
MVVLVGEVVALLVRVLEVAYAVRAVGIKATVEEFVLALAATLVPEGVIDGTAAVPTVHGAILARLEPTEDLAFAELEATR